MERGRERESQTEQARAGERKSRPFATHKKKNVVYLYYFFIIELIA